MTEASWATTTDHHATRALSGRFLFDTADHRRAAEVLDHLIGGWTGWARNLNWPLTLAETAEIAAGLGATEHAERIADELEPYAGELVVTGIGILCLGAFDRYRGSTCSTCSAATTKPSPRSPQPSPWRNPSSHRP